MTKLISPAPNRPVTSPFGWRINPITGKRRHHNGIDYGGTFVVRVAAAGTVITNGFSPSKVNGFGYYVVIQHEGGLRTLYAHGRERSKLRVGARVRAGDTVFTSGSTGASTGPHLHFEVHRRILGFYRPVNPMPYFSKPKPKPDNTTDRKKRTWLG